MYPRLLEDVSHGILQKECVFNDSEDFQTYDDLDLHGPSSWNCVLNCKTFFHNENKSFFLLNEDHSLDSE